MTSNETSFALFKSIIAENIDAYELWSTINFPGSRVSDFAVNLCAQKINEAQTKRVNITGVHYFRRFDIAYACINSSDVNFVLSFILY